MRKIEENCFVQAGLPVTMDYQVSFEDAQNIQKLTQIIEKSRPLWTPGQETGYHAVTFGWLVDILMRKVDKQRRGIQQFVKEELSMKHGKLQTLNVFHQFPQ